MSAGLLESARNLLAGILDLGRTRFELFGTELREELARLAAAIVGGLAVLVLAALACIPFVGGFVAFATLVVGLGAVLLSSRPAMTARTAPQASA